MLSSHLGGSYLVTVQTRLHLLVLTGIGAVTLILTTIPLIQAPSILAFYPVAMGANVLLAHVVSRDCLKRHGSLCPVLIACLWLSPTLTAIPGIQFASVALLYRPVQCFVLRAEATFGTRQGHSRSAEELARFGPDLERREAYVLYPVEAGSP